MRNSVVSENLTLSKATEGCRIANVLLLPERVEFVEEMSDRRQSIEMVRAGREFGVWLVSRLVEWIESR